MKPCREQFLAEMGLPVRWVLREPFVASRAVPPASPLASLPAANAGEEAVMRESAVLPGAVRSSTPVAEPAAPIRDGRAVADGLDWPGLAERVAHCRACELCEQRKQAVLGVGDSRAPDWLFIGEGPGAEEDVRGEPFVGQAGKLLDAMLAALDLRRGERVYIANAVKCRPPGNRTPEPREMAACRPYLDRQIELLRPRIIVLLGKAAVHSVLHEEGTLTSLRGREFRYAGIPVVVTYHPAYLLRNLPDKAKAWADLLFARRVLQGAAATGLAG